MGILTKLYLTSSITPSVSPAFNGAWDVTGDAIRREMGLVKQGTSFTTKSIIETNGAIHDILFVQWVSPPLNAVTFVQNDSLSVSIRVLENDGQANFSYRTSIKVVSEDGSTLRQTLRDIITTGGWGNEWDAKDFESRYAAAGIISNWSGMIDGDRIVFELGILANNTKTTSFQGDMRIGDNASVWLDASDGDMNEDNPWFEIEASAALTAYVSGYTIDMAAGDFDLTGQVVDLKRDAKIVPASANFAFTGQTMNPELDRRIDMGAGDFDLNGQVVNFLRDYNIIMGIDNFALTGQPANLEYDRIIPMAAGDFDLTGQDVTLSKGFFIDMQPGDFDLTGFDVNFLRDYLIKANVGDFDLVGQIVNLKYDRIMPLEAGSFIETGQIVNFLRDYNIIIGAEAFDFTGQIVNLLKDYLIKAATDSFAFNGQAVGVLHDKKLLLETDAFDFIGSDVTLLYGGEPIKITIEAGSFVFTGVATGLIYGKLAQPDKIIVDPIVDPIAEIIVLPLYERE